MSASIAPLILKFDAKIDVTGQYHTTHCPSDSRLCGAQIRLNDLEKRVFLTSPRIRNPVCPPSSLIVTVALHS